MSCVASTAWAAPPETAPGSQEARADKILVHVVADNPAILARIRAELGLQGYEDDAVLELEDAGPARAELLDHLLETDAQAAVEIIVSEERVDLWVADRETDKALFRRLLGEQADPRTLASAALELLRVAQLEASESGVLLGRSLDDERAPGFEDVDGSVDEPEEFVPKGSLAVAPVVGGSPGGFGVTTHLDVSARWTPPKLERFGLRFSLMLPLIGNQILGEEGSAQVFVGMAFVEPQLRLPGGVPWFHPELGLGIGGAVLGIIGTANDTTRSATDVIGSFCANAHVGLGFEVRPRLWVRADGFLGFLQPQPRVIFGTSPVASWGVPWSGGALGIEVWL